MTEHVEQSILEKIKKLLNLAQNNNEPEEAEAAAAQAQKLIDKYKIDRASVEKIDLNSTPIHNNIITKTLQRDQIGKHCMLVWKKRLSFIIAHHNGVRAIVWGRRTVELIGRAEDVEVCEYLLCYLLREIEKIALRKYEETDKSVLKGTYEEHFGLGAGKAINNRLYAEREKSNHASEINALVLYDSKAVELWMEKQKKYAGLKNTKMGAQTRATNAMIEGYEEGEKINLNKAVAAPKTQKAIK